MSHRVVLGPRAEAELSEIASWLASRSTDGALRWLEAFEVAKESLATMPHAGEVAPESDYLNIEVRQITFKTRSGRRYRLLYSVVDSDVRILHIRGPGQPNMTSDEF